MTQRAALRVLLVEDDPGDARLVDILLAEEDRSSSFEVTHAGRLDEALERLEQQAFDVILLDQSLPDSSGLETVDRTRTAAPGTPVVVLSGQDDEDVALQALQSGAQEYLIKGQGDGDLIARSIRYAIERRRADEALRQNEERFRSLVQNASDTIIILEADGTVRYVSPAIARVLGLQAEDVIGKNAVAFVDPVDRTKAIRTFAEAKKEPGIRPPVEFRLRHKDGTWRHLELNRSNLLDDPAVGGLVFNLRDVTERKVAEEQLRRRAFHDLLGGLQSRYLLLDAVQERGNCQDRLNEGVPRCEFGEILLGESCELPGTIWSEGKLLCETHARQSELQDRIDLLRGVVTSLELCLDNVAVRRDANFVRLLKAEVAHATAELELAHGELQRAKGQG